MASHSHSINKHHGVCTWWIAYTFDNPLRRIIHRPQKVLGPYVKEAMTVMDLGCGMGHFSIGMAGLVGNSGRVVAIDLQQKMLDIMHSRAMRAGLAERITPHLCRAENIGIEKQVDFILAFWMVHEVPDQKGLFNELKSILAPQGKILIAEPKMHVSAKDFKSTLALAEASGLKCDATPKIRLSRTALLSARDSRQ